MTGSSLLDSVIDISDFTPFGLTGYDIGYIGGMGILRWLLFEMFRATKNANESQGGGAPYRHLQVVKEDSIKVKLRF